MPGEVLRPLIQRIDTLTDVLEYTENKRQKILDLMHSIPCLCTLKSVDTGKYEYANKAFCEFVGKSEAEVVGRTNLDLFAREEVAQLLSMEVDVIQKKASTVILTPFKGKLYFIVKFLVVNGGVSVGSIGIEIPSSFKLVEERKD